MITHRLFPGQQDDEQIITVIRQHWLYISGKVLIWFVFVAILFWFDYYGQNNFPELFQSPALAYTDLVKTIYVMFLMLGLFMIWIVYYLNTWIITNKRIVDVSQEGIFNQRISELTLPNIEDVTSKVNGVFGTFFSYGDVEIQTAGTKENFVFEKVPKPKDIERLIFNLIDKHPVAPNGNE